MSNQNTFLPVWLLKPRIKGRAPACCSFQRTDRRRSAPSFCERLYRSAVAEPSDSTSAASLFLARVRAPSLRYATYLPRSRGAAAGGGETATGILKEDRLCRHRVWPCGSAPAFSQGSRPLQKKEKKKEKASTGTKVKQSRAIQNLKYAVSR